MSELRQFKRHPKLVELTKKQVKKSMDRNLERYNFKVGSIINLYHQLCLQWEDKGIPDYKNEIFKACNARWLKYCKYQRFSRPKPKKEYFEELIKQVI